MFQISTSNVTLHREGRRAHLTDDSALGSLRDPDESTAHDADIDSDMDVSLSLARHQPLYYPNQQDSASGSEFTVTNIDADELRKSQRRMKRSNLPAILVQSPTTTIGSQDSEEDDDEVSLRVVLLFFGLFLCSFSLFLYFICSFRGAFLVLLRERS